MRKLQKENKNYYTFKGWSTQKNDSSKIVDDLENKIIENDMILYAIFDINKYTVKYIDQNEEEENEVEAGTIIINKQEKGKTGYTFLGWYEGDNKIDFPITVDKNITLEAKYKINKYSMKFNDEGNIIKTVTIEYGNTINTSDIPEVSKEGYTFTGWKEENSSDNYDFNNPISSDVELKSTYKKIKNGVVFIDINNTTTKEVEYGDKVDEIVPEGKKGYTFLGWYEKENGVYKENSFDFNTEIKTSITLYAVYSVNKYTLTINPNGGKYNNQDTIEEEIEYNSTYELSNPSKEGYTFTGWTSSVESALDGNTVTMPDSSVTVTANYTPIEYTIEYDLDEGSLEEGKTNPKKYTIESENIVLNNPSKKGYTFIGWKENEIVNETYTIEKGTIGNKSLVAVYSVNKYTLTINPNGGKYNNQDTIVEEKRI